MLQTTFFSSLLVSVPENVFHWKRGRKSGKQAVKDVAKDTATSAGVGVVAKGVAHVAARFVPVGLGGPLGIAITAASLGLVVYSAGRRLITAARRDFPFDEYQLFFCAEGDCGTQYALSVTNEALGVNDESGWSSGIRLISLVSICLAVVLVAVIIGWFLT